MPVQPLPVDEVTERFLILGLPVIEFAYETSPSIFGPYFSIGIPDSAEVTKELQQAQLRNAQSGASKLVRELVRQFDATIAVSTFNHSGQNMQLMFASQSLTLLNAQVVAVPSEIVNLQPSDLVFLSLAQQLLVQAPGPTVAAAEISAEDVGTGQGGTFGEVTGDFALDYKVSVVADVSLLTVGGVDRTADIVAGVSPLAGEIGIEEGSVAASGQLTFPSGEGPANGAALIATYQPSFGPLVENTDFVVDYLDGRVRVIGPFDGPTDDFRSGQPMTVGYSYDQPEQQQIAPFTQFVFAGRARIRQLTQVGENLIWPIPKAQARLTADAFVFNRDDLTVTSLALQLLEDTANPSAPYGLMGIYQEGTF
jgi:hypothetical protein